MGCVCEVSVPTEDSTEDSEVSVPAGLCELFADEFATGLAWGLLISVPLWLLMFVVFVVLWRVSH
jgi:hypothetical protein